MEKDNHQQWSAPHLEIDIDPNNPPPTASQSFIDIRQQGANIWAKFEASEKALIPLDDEVNAEVLNYVSSHPHAKATDIRVERSRITMRLYLPRIAENELRCQELVKAIIALEQSALKEPETVEARATLEIDIDIMQRCLTTTRVIIEVAGIQLAKAEDMLKDSRKN
jgi:hypothetical protein